jgi:hypothetical protein
LDKAATFYWEGIIVGTASRTDRFTASPQAVPRSANSLKMVFWETPNMREVARIELPSTSAAITWVRRLLSSKFIVAIMLEQIEKVKLKRESFFVS